MAKTTRSPSTDGMPEIGEKKTRHPLALVGLALTFIVIGAMGYFRHRDRSDPPEPRIEETYTLPRRPPPLLPPQGSSTQTALPPPAAATFSEEQRRFLQAKQKELEQRLTAPVVVFNQSTAAAHATSEIAALGDVNLQFMQHVTSQPTATVQATAIGPLNWLIAEGKFIHAVLETAINSDLPGYVRAMIDRPVYSEDGTHALIPAGSRLIGRYNSGLWQGQSRVFVVWTRVLIPNGTRVSLGSPGVDRLGQAGMGADTMDRHFWQQFGQAILLSMIGAGAANVGVNRADQYNAAQAYRTAVVDSFSQTAQQSLPSQGLIPPTLKIEPGKPIQVFVARDLNFKPALGSTLAPIPVF